MNREPPAAAESAWALGKQDLERALVRVKSRVLTASPDTGGYQGSTIYDYAGKNSASNRRTNRDKRSSMPAA